MLLRANFGGRKRGDLLPQSKKLYESSQPEVHKTKGKCSKAKLISKTYCQAHTARTQSLDLLVQLFSVFQNSVQQSVVKTGPLKRRQVLGCCILQDFLVVPSHALGQWIP